jgi:D-alanine-D-alanine ligase-like ATP-grasp enzyme
LSLLPFPFFLSQSVFLHLLVYTSNASQAVEFVFPPGETFKHFDLKWVDYDNMGMRLCPDPSLDARLRAAAAKAFTGLGGTSFGRADMRVDEDTGEIYFLEMNPNCGIFYPPGQYAGEWSPPSRYIYTVVS